MKKIYSMLLLCVAICLTLNSSAQQIKVTNPATCSGNRTYFTIPPFALPPSTNIESYTFYIGADTVTTTENEYNVLFSPGLYSASAKIVLSNDSVLYTNLETFGIADYPVAAFSFVNGNVLCNADSVICVTNTSVAGSLPISQVYWIWGDPKNSDTSKAGACHKYDQAGSYSIRLVVSDTIGCTSDTSLVVQIREAINPQISWTGQPGCSGSSYLFTNNYHSGISSYTWNFGDGQTYSATAPFSNDERLHLDSITHTYTIDGVFTPSISMSDSNGCSIIDSHNPGHLQLPANIVTDGKIHSSNASIIPYGANEQVFCFAQNVVHFEPPTSQFDFSQYWSGSGIWTFDDPASQQLNYINWTAQPSHQFIEPGIHIVKLDLSSDFPNCVFYDTLDLVGPVAMIENPSLWWVSMNPAQKYQQKGTDTVDFINTTINYGVNNKVSFVWDFDDQYAPVCTAYSVPKPGVPLPFTTALEQYENSNHFYIRNGITYSGKMNCRWSLDSLPRHVYTNWDSVYSWYLNGKTFPSTWDLAPIEAARVLSTSESQKIPDPFLFAQGKNAFLPDGNVISPLGNLQFSGPYNGYDTIPNSNQTFYEYLFYNSVVHNFNVTLNAFDSLGKGCPSQSGVTLKFGKPNAMKMVFGGKQCSGANPNGVSFDLSKLNNTVVLINFDSLADRKDGTPCTIDGFVDYQGGITPGGLNLLPFFSQRNFIPPAIWQNGAGNMIYYHYGPNAPANRPAPADSVNGYITIGVIIGSGCANPPECTQAEIYSDTVWFHNIFQIQTQNARFEIQNEGKLFSKNQQVTVIPDEPYQPSIKHDTWGWGDGTYTVDSFEYSGMKGLPENITDGHFVNGKRRVRYQYTTDNFGNYVLYDSLPFPNGFPGSRINTDTFNNNQCISNPTETYIEKDSAMLLLPLTHALNKSSYEVNEDSENPTIGNIIHLIGNNQGCYQAHALPITVGIIDSLTITSGKQILCKGETITTKGYARYFRCDNSFTDPMINPNYSCATLTRYAPPFDQYNFDTLDFWRLNKNQTTNIKYTYFNTATQKTDTVFYEKMYWDFGDGTSLVSGINANHSYSSPGNYTITMITRDSMGGWDSCFKEITVSGPKAKIGLPPSPFWPFEPRNIFTCGEVPQFIDSSDVNNRGNSTDFIKTNYWWFGDQGDTIDWQLNNTTGYFSHAYKSNGTFNIKLVTESNLGCTDTAHARIYISGPRPAFKIISATTGCAPYTVKLVNQADLFGKFITSNGTPLASDTPTQTTYFNFGDGNTPLVVTNRKDTIEYTFQSEGSYSIVATGSDASNGAPNTCEPAVFPNPAGNIFNIITVRNVVTNGIVGESSAALSSSEYYSVSRTPNASYRWTLAGGTITASNQDSSTIRIDWSTNDGQFQLICKKSTDQCFTSDTLRVTVGSPNGIEETQLSKTNLMIYPNPASGNFTLKWNQPVREQLHVQLFDIVGKVYLSKTILPGAPAEHTFDIQNLKSGIYFIGIQSESRSYSYKLLVE